MCKLEYLSCENQSISNVLTCHLQNSPFIWQQKVFYHADDSLSQVDYIAILSPHLNHFLFLHRLIFSFLLLENPFGCKHAFNLFRVAIQQHVEHSLAILSLWINSSLAHLVRCCKLSLNSVLCNRLCHRWQQGLCFLLHDLLSTDSLEVLDSQVSHSLQIL